MHTCLKTLSKQIIIYIHTHVHIKLASSSLEDHMDPHNEAIYKDKQLRKKLDSIQTSNIHTFFKIFKRQKPYIEDVNQPIYHYSITIFLYGSSFAHSLHHL